MEVKPLHDFVLIELSEVEETTAGGLVLTSATQENPHYGIVKAIGPGAMSIKGERIEMNVSVNDKVAFNTNYKSHPALDEGTILIRETELVAILKDS